MTIEDQLKQAIRKSGLSLYRLYRETDVHTACLYNFMAGKQSLRLDLAARLAACLGFELRKIESEKTTAKKGK